VLVQAQAQRRPGAEWWCRGGVGMWSELLLSTTVTETPRHLSSFFSSSFCCCPLLLLDPHGRHHVSRKCVNNSLINDG
jgi:hypothetical protein